ncbi:pyrroline-5-carboxylate reductase [Terribacillus saccharophilus]|uniref:Pyrroline-5-carboxylate reductase n=1 Tax=Terribacillus saccharophilus TaxID=361277 RepID=A0A268A7D3_9BACI|nr:pyrroline-5-carboxylate reductase [Terribacillus saccharophilus]PAD19989.1 pyrroline-5-carboxylate reductase [Terribacillus saccharophilus]
MLTNKRILYVGAGSMAEGMIAGMNRSDSMRNEQVYVTNRSNSERLYELQERYAITGIPQAEVDWRSMDVIVLAMKPKDITASLIDLQDKVQEGQLVISVAAGIQNEQIEHYLPENQPVVRIMPNTSSTIGESATAIAPGTHVSVEQLTDVTELVKTFGEAFVITEEHMDVFTGMAGSGPAYFYKLIEHFEETGVAAGFDPDTARKIGTQTMLGAARMLMETEEEPAILRKKVTSPNGTTAAGLEALNDAGAGEAITKAILSAAERSNEISEELKKQLLTR